MIIEDKKVVSVSYHLASKNNINPIESFVEKTDKEHPLTFIFGTGGLIEAFENNLKGKKKGDKFDFFIDSANAYGTRDESKLADIPMNVFVGQSGKLDTTIFKVGAIIPMSDDKGNKMQARVEKITESHIHMDFNHPMAGHDLHFVGEVIEVRNATKEELEHGHVHGPGGHHH